MCQLKREELCLKLLVKINLGLRFVSKYVLIYIIKSLVKSCNFRLEGLTEGNPYVISLPMSIAAIFNMTTP